MNGGKNWTAVALLEAVLVLAVAVRLPGIHWLDGYGFEADFSFHPDDNRFIGLAKDFWNPFLNTYGYPLFMVSQIVAVYWLLHEVMHIVLYDAIVMRWISVTYAVLGLILIYAFARGLGWSRLTGLLAAFLLALAPLHIVLSHFGTADISVLFLFYLTIYTAWRYRMTGNDFWFYATFAAAGVAMADKFFVPVLLPPALILVFRPTGRRLGAGFLACCVSIAVFYAASLFMYTPWVFGRLLADQENQMAMAGGKSPPGQIVAYSWELIAASGVITFALAAIEVVFGIGRNIGRLSFPTVASLGRWLRSPTANIVLPLALLAILIVTARVHFMRHILPLVPVICVLAAACLARAVSWLVTLQPVARFVGFAALAALLGVQLADGVVTDWVYPNDIRAQVDDFLVGKDLVSQTVVSSHFTHFRGVSAIGIDDLPQAPIFVACDLEYRRYQLAARGVAVFNLIGGQRRLDFYTALFAGKSDYAALLVVERRRYSLEDRLAAAGWLPEIETYVPDECRVFQKK